MTWDIFYKIFSIVIPEFRNWNRYGRELEIPIETIFEGRFLERDANAKK